MVTAGRPSTLKVCVDTTSSVAEKTERLQREFMFVVKLSSRPFYKIGLQFQLLVFCSLFDQFGTTALLFCLFQRGTGIKANTNVPLFDGGFEKTVATYNERVGNQEGQSLWNLS